jgi:hypothetical protein
MLIIWIIVILLKIAFLLQHASFGTNFEDLGARLLYLMSSASVGLCESKLENMAFANRSSRKSKQNGAKSTYYP